MQRLLAAFFVGISASACGASSSAPATPSATVTKIVVLSGNLAFGGTQVGKTVTKPLTIANSGPPADRERAYVADRLQRKLDEWDH